MFPAALHGLDVDGARICANWELRVTRRCLQEDVGASPDADFADIVGLEIVKALVSDRTDRHDDTRTVSGIKTGVAVDVLSRGHDHRGGTVYDDNERVVWLVAYGRHRSGAPDDFFPYCRRLADDGVLLPTDADYERMFRERDRRFVEALVIEGPLILKRARETGTEQRVSLGGAHGACVAVEADEQLEAITVAFRVGTVEFDLVPVILAAISVGEWEPHAHMPSRALDSDEFACTQLREAPGP